MVSFIYRVNWWLLCGVFCSVCCCCRGFGVRVDELELVGVVWRVRCVAGWLFLNGLIWRGKGGGGVIVWSPLVVLLICWGVIVWGLL